MTLTTCIGCPLRQNCEIRDEKRRQLKGLGLTEAKFKCSKRRTLFSPGQSVVFTSTRNTNGTEEDIEAWVWNWQGNKVRCVSDETERPVFLLYPDRLSHDDTRPALDCCIHCGKPRGMAMETWGSGEYHPYYCRYGSEACEFAQAETPRTNLVQPGAGEEGR
jgi:hypothetical protein